MIRRPPRSTLFPYRRSSDLHPLQEQKQHDRGGERQQRHDTDVDIEDRDAGARQRAELQPAQIRSEEHTSELQSRLHLVCRLLLEKKKKKNNTSTIKSTKQAT